MLVQPKHLYVVSTNAVLSISNDLILPQCLSKTPPNIRNGEIMNYWYPILLHCALTCGAVYCNQSCLFVCVFVGLSLFVCGSVNTITRNCVHRSSPNWVITFWPSRAPGKGVCGGAKIFRSALSQRAVFVSPLSAFSFTEVQLTDVAQITLQTISTMYKNSTFCTFGLYRAYCEVKLSIDHWAFIKNKNKIKNIYFFNFFIFLFFIYFFLFFYFFFIS